MQRGQKIYDRLEDKTKMSTGCASMLFFVRKLSLTCTWNQPAIQRSRVRSPNLEMSKSKLKLMVVDDEQDNLDLIYRTFRRQFPIFLADSPATAMKIIDAEGEMAIIISDQSMPEMTGIEFLSKISDRFPNTIRILLTGYSEDALEDDREILKAAQIFQCVTKPWEAENLKAIVQQAAEVYQASLE